MSHRKLQGKDLTERSDLNEATIHTMGLVKNDMLLLVFIQGSSSIIDWVSFFHSCTIVQIILIVEPSQHDRPNNGPLRN